MSHKLTEREKWRICVECAFIYDINNTRFTHGGLRELSRKFDLSEKCIRNVFNQFLAQRDNQEEISLAPNYKNHSGRKRQLDDQLQIRIQEVIDSNNGEITYGELGEQLREEGFDRCNMTFYNYCQVMEINFRSSYCKPILTEKNRMERLRFVLNEIDRSDPGNLRFHSQYDRVYIDEKWFRLEMLKTKRKHFINSPQHHPNRVRSKQDLTQVMFTAAITEPRGDDEGTLTLMPHVEEVAAQRSSINRPRGTIELKPYNITADAFYECMTMEYGLLESINDSMRAFYIGQIVLQMDNASAHTGHENKAKIEEYIDEQNLDIRLVYQPPHSPDLNICDLAFFASLQKKTNKIKKNSHATGISGIIDSVTEAFEDYDGNTLRLAYGHLYAIYNKILESQGDNNFSEPHDHVRYNLTHGQDIRRVKLTIDEINNLTATVHAYFQNV
jgi:hypothetical protein